MINYRDYLESNANVMLGKPVIKGSRITVELILRHLSEGASFHSIIEAYPSISEMQILAVLAYAHDVVANEAIIEAA